MTSPFIMTNSWSLLYDELKMDEYPYSDYQFNMTMNEHSGMIDFTKTAVNMTEPTNHLWKYNEDKILKDKIGRAHV